MFWHKKNLASGEYEILLKRIIGLEADIGSLRAKIESQSSLVASLRGLVNRKIGKSLGDDEDPTESNINNVLLPE